MLKCMQFVLNNSVGRFNEQLFFGLVFSRSAFRKYFQLLLLTLRPWFRMFIFEYLIIRTTEF